MLATTDLLGGHHDPSQAAMLAIAKDAGGERGCRIRGCGRPADDPIHI